MLLIQIVVEQAFAVESGAIQGEIVDETGNLIHEPTKQLIQELLKSLVDWTRRISPAPAKLTLLEAQLMEGEIQRPEPLNSPVTETSARNGAWR